jgi:hypothetical protein
MAVWLQSTRLARRVAELLSLTVCMYRISSIFLFGAIVALAASLAFSFVSRNAKQSVVRGKTEGIVLDHNWTTYPDLWSENSYKSYGLIQFGDGTSFFRCQTCIAVGPFSLLVSLPASVVAVSFLVLICVGFYLFARVGGRAE